MLSFLKNINLGFLNPLSANDGYVALDIGSSSIKMVETAIEKNGYRVLNMGILPLPEYAIQNNMVVDSKPVVESIRKLIHENGVKSRQVISAVPGRAVIMKKVQMPKQEPAELEANIEFEAQNVIPENLENVNLDHQVLHEADDGNKMDVLLVAVKKEIVNSYADAIEEAGLMPTVMDVDYFALENMYEANYAAEAQGGVPSKGPRSRGPPAASDRPRAPRRRPGSSRPAARPGSARSPHRAGARGWPPSPS